MLKLNVTLKAVEYLQQYCTERNNVWENCSWSAEKEILCLWGA
jgi:hypothetical protein